MKTYYRYVTTTTAEGLERRVYITNADGHLKTSMLMSMLRNGDVTVRANYALLGEILDSYRELHTACADLTRQCVELISNIQDLSNDAPRLALPEPTPELTVEMNARHAFVPEDLLLAALTAREKEKKRLVKIRSRKAELQAEYTALCQHPAGGWLA